MKKHLLILTLAMTVVVYSSAQVIIQENFESGSFPSGWSQVTNATDSGWRVGSFTDLSSQYWPIAVNGSIQIAATNDDGCNCDKSNDYLIMPPIDLTGVSSAVLRVDLFFNAGTYEGFSENATIEVSLDGITWTVVEHLHEPAEWESYSINLSQFAGEDSVYIGFHYDDGGGWLFGLAIDNVVVEVPVALDASLTEVNARSFGEENVSIPIGGTAYNNGVEVITSMEIQYSVTGNNPEIAIFDSLDIQPFTDFKFNHPIAWIPQSSGIYDVQLAIVKVNGSPDQNVSNDSLSFQIEIYPHVVTPNKIDDFFLAEPIFTTVASGIDGLDKPNDLDFFPILAKNELWVVNERLANSGGSTTTIYDAGTQDQVFLNRVDGNAWHFMSLPTGIAFSDNFNFGTSPGIKDANHSNGTFTGPSLWSSDPDIYAQPSGGNGSHLDMLHGSPYSMGIASEGDNIFWVFDGWNQTIVRYDFQEDHGPGNDDHSDGIVRRYTEIQVKREESVPSHLALDKVSGWLYAVDNGNDRVIRLDIHSGNVLNPLPLINEPLSEHSQMVNVNWEVIIDSGLDQPSGIEIFENRLLVGDYATGEIIVYDTDNDFGELGRIITGLPGLTGIRIGPDGAIWYTNRLENTLTKMEPGEITGVIPDPLLGQIHVVPNPTSGIVFINLPQSEGLKGTRLDLFDALGRKLVTMENLDEDVQLNLSNLENGIYMISFSNGALTSTTKIVLQH